MKLFYILLCFMYESVKHSEIFCVNKESRKEEKMNKSNKVRGLILAGALMFAMAGCGNQVQEQPENTKAPEKVSTEVSNASAGEQEATPEPTPEPTPEVTPEPVELDAVFDEEFVINPNEKLNIGRAGISISLNWITYDEYGTSFGYSLFVDGKEITGMGFDGTYVDNQVYQNEFTENRVICVDAKEDQNVTLKITAGTEIPAPMVLSGNAADEYITTKPEYIESEEVILFLAENVKVYGNTMELIEQLIDIVEKDTGLYLENDSVYSTMNGNETDWLYGQDVFPGVDPYAEKFHVYVVEYDVCSACAYGYGIVINPQDLEIAAGEGYTILHEVAHCVHLLNGVQMGRTMDEGYASYISGRICDKDEEMIYNYNSRNNFSYYPVEITPDNAEEIFCSEKEDDFENYLYGYRFFTYLFETYGENVFKDILADASPDEAVWYVSISDVKTVPYIKANTSETVFEDFANWLAANKERFEYQ